MYVAGRWDEGYEEVWLIVTDVAQHKPRRLVRYEKLDRRWFKDTKRGGWSWHQTKMVDPSGLNDCA